jgi:hypothetical protein
MAARIVTAEETSATCRIELVEYRRASAALTAECQRTIAAAEEPERRGRKAEAKGNKARLALEDAANKADAAAAAAAEAEAEVEAIKVRAATAAERAEGDIAEVASLRARALDAEAVALDCVERLETARQYDMEVAIARADEVGCCVTPLPGGVRLVTWTPY